MLFSYLFELYKNDEDYFWMSDRLREILESLSFASEYMYVFRDLFSLLILFLLCMVSFYISRYVIVKIIEQIVSKTKNDWDDKLFSNKFFNRLAYIVPAIITIKLLPYAIPYSPGWISFVSVSIKLYMVIIVLLSLFALLNSFNDIYNEWEIAKYKPIKGYIQLFKILLSLIGAILIFAFILGQSPIIFLTGLGAISAVLMLVFKDALLGLVAGIQLSANDMVRPGDWITMTKYQADGDVLDITLTTVKVQNFDRTIVYIPAYTMISDSFINWRGMYDSEGRRIKRALFIDMNSVKFCTDSMLEDLKKYSLITDYIENRQKEINEYNSRIPSDTSVPVNGRRQTNIGIFRAYMEHYIRSLTTINQETILMVRQLPPTDKGVPLEVYAFCISKEWVIYETVQSDIFDHLIAALPHFHLRLYQSPTGGDVHGFISHALHASE
jgi:miniconductance mechanosensitive channel